MYTLDEVKTILDTDDAMTLEGYNLMRTNLLTVLAPALEEVAALEGHIKELEIENERLKAANITLYNKVEKQIMKTDEEEQEEETEVKTAEEVLEENVRAYADAI